MEGVQIGGHVVKHSVRSEKAPEPVGAYVHARRVGGLQIDGVGMRRAVQDEDVLRVRQRSAIVVGAPPIYHGRSR